MREASDKRCGESAVRRILRCLDAALRASRHEEREDRLGQRYWEALGVTGEAEFDYRPPSEALSVMSRMQLLTRMSGESIWVKLLLPRELFEEKDYLNHVYSWKKCMYLQAVKERLGALPEVKFSRANFLRGDVRSPVLRVDYQSESCTQRSVQGMKWEISQ